MAIVSKVNQYLGANAHFQSYCQAANAPIFAGLNSHQRWRMFHSQYIVACANALTEQLEQYGYVAQVETSLQIREIEDESDVTVVYDPQSGIDYPQPSGKTPDSAAIAIPLDVALGIKEGTRLRSIAIQPLAAGQSKPVTWIEVLSPANKPGGRHAQEYADKRVDVVNLGIPLIEIDLLHKQPPVVGGLPTYCRWDAENARYVTDQTAKPFLISILGAEILGGDALVYPFGVDEIFPTVPIPLLKTSSPFDFGIPYHMAFEQSGNYRVVNYEEEPSQLTAYNDRDREAILKRMGTVRAYVQKHGVEKLQDGPFPVLMAGQEPPDLAGSPSSANGER